MECYKAPHSCCPTSQVSRSCAAVLSVITRSGSPRTLHCAITEALQKVQGLSLTLDKVTLGCNDKEIALVYRRETGATVVEVFRRVFLLQMAINTTCSKFPRLTIIHDPVIAHLHRTGWTRNTRQLRCRSITTLWPKCCVPHFQFCLTGLAQLTRCQKAEGVQDQAYIENQAKKTKPLRSMK